MKTVADIRKVYLTTGDLVAYVAKRSGFEGEHWMVASGLPTNVHRAATDAITSLDGLPSSDALSRTINEKLA